MPQRNDFQAENRISKSICDVIENRMNLNVDAADDVGRENDKADSDYRGPLSCM